MPYEQDAGRLTAMHTASTFSLSNEEFLADLYGFMAKRGQPITKVPSLGYQELDLYLLYKLVIERGGMDEVTRKQEWKLVYQDLNIPTMSTSASYNTRTNYKKYLYLYELEYCDFSDLSRPKDAEARFQVGQYIRIVSSVFEGQVFYAKILKSRYKEGRYQHYVHYNGWNSSHDEWMREDVLDLLLPEEQKHPDSLPNPPPSRSSKSNHLIYDPSLSDKVLSNLLQHQSPSKAKTQIHPLSPTSPAYNAKKARKSANYSSPIGYQDSSATSEEEEAAQDLLELTILPQLRRNSLSISNASVPVVLAPAAKRRPRPVEFVDYPMRPETLQSISRIMEGRLGPHEADLIHRNRLHSHVLVGYDDQSEQDEREHEVIAQLLAGIKFELAEPSEATKKALLEFDQVVHEAGKVKEPSGKKLRQDDGESDDPRALDDIHKSLVELQSSLLAKQNDYKHTMRVLKKHHGVTALPALPLPRKSAITTRRSERN
jgi:hypothetical protein